jgi:hypothetical protein
VIPPEPPPAEDFVHAVTASPDEPNDELAVLDAGWD